MDPSSMVPQALMGPMMPLPFDVSASPTADIQRSGPVPMSTLASALASATPETQRMVCYCHFFCVSLLIVITN